MEPPSLPRFEATQRRDFLKRAAMIGALALVPGLAACSTGDDKTTFTDSSTTTSDGSTSTTTASSDATTSTAGSATSDGALPDGAALAIGFTWAAASGAGPGRNPYVAVWVETPDGALVANVGVWYDPPKGDRWINNLASWSSAVTSTSADYLKTTTGATRAAGTYSLSWDGTDASGARAGQGDYVVFIEAAQEHGTHSLTSAPITLGTAGATTALAGDGDLSAATATYTP
ncbi:MAG: uncharacterized protein JWO77_1472 [Ilumatobacteraceae bacterium]|nr:uncharacterized protein [Ilumatobacteraceae bacterium]